MYPTSQRQFLALQSDRDRTQVTFRLAAVLQPGRYIPASVEVSFSYRLVAASYLVYTIELFMCYNIKIHVINSKFLLKIKRFHNPTQTPEMEMLIVIIVNIHIGWFSVSLCSLISLPAAKKLWV